MNAEKMRSERSAQPPVDAILRELLEQDSVRLHGYTPAAGLPELRRAAAEALSAGSGTPIRPERVYITCGAEAGLAVCFRALVCAGEEAVVPAREAERYRAFAEAAGAVLRQAPADGGEPDWEAFAAALNEKTQLVILGGADFAASEAALARIGELLRAASQRCGHPILLAAVVSERDPLCGVLRHYDDTILCGSFGGALSLPGECIGFLAVGSGAAQGEDLFDALAGAARASGYVNAPSLMQRAVGKGLERGGERLG